MSCKSIIAIVGSTLILHMSGPLLAESTVSEEDKRPRHEAMSEEDREARRAERKARREAMSDEKREAKRAERKARHEAMSDEERAAKRAERKAGRE